MKNTIKPLRLLTPLALVLAFASCSIYHPQAVDMPLINHQGDVRVNATASTSVFLVLPDAFNLNATASYGFNDWLSGQLHANYGGDNWYMQAAPGIYRTLGDKGVAELYFGLGYGGSNHDNTNDSDTASSENYRYYGHYFLPFAQLNFGWRDLGPVDIVFGIKGGLFSPDFRYRQYDSDGAEMTDKFVHYATPNFLLEPQLQFGIGSDKFKVTFQFGYTYMSDLNAASSKMYHDFITVSTGFKFTF